MDHRNLNNALLAHFSHHLGVLILVELIFTCDVGLRNQALTVILGCLIVIGCQIVLELHRVERLHLLPVDSKSICSSHDGSHSIARGVFRVLLSITAVHPLRPSLRVLSSLLTRCECLVSNHLSLTIVLHDQLRPIAASAIPDFQLDGVTGLLINRLYGEVILEHLLRFLLDLFSSGVVRGSLLPW